jgi:hypothetical protein
MSRTVRTVLAGVVSAGILLVGAGAAFADSDTDSDANSYTEHVHHERSDSGLLHGVSLLGNNSLGGILDDLPLL